MTEEIEKIETTEESITTEAEKTTETEQNKNTEKVLKQSEVNKLIAREVSTEKAKHKKLADSWEQEKQGYASQIESYETMFKATVDELKVNISEEILELLSEKTILEQYDWLMKHSKKETKKTIEPTPKTEVKKTNNSVKNRNLY